MAACTVALAEFPGSKNSRSCQFQLLPKVERYQPSDRPIRVPIARMTNPMRKMWPSTLSWILAPSNTKRMISAITHKLSKPPRSRRASGASISIKKKSPSPSRPSSQKIPENLPLRPPARGQSLRQPGPPAPHFASSFAGLTMRPGDELQTSPAKLLTQFAE